MYRLDVARRLIAILIALAVSAPLALGGAVPQWPCAPETPCCCEACAGGGQCCQAEPADGDLDRPAQTVPVPPGPLAPALSASWHPRPAAPPAAADLDRPDAPPDRRAASPVALKWRLNR